MNRIWIYIQYWISFALIPMVVVIRELMRLYDESMVWWDIKRQMKAQYEMYKKFKKTKK